MLIIPAIFKCAKSYTHFLKNISGISYQKMLTIVLRHTLNEILIKTFLKPGMWYAPISATQKTKARGLRV
jgi:hypothetical protein